MLRNGGKNGLPRPERGALILLMKSSHRFVHRPADHSPAQTSAIRPAPLSCSRIPKDWPRGQHLVEMITLPKQQTLQSAFFPGRTRASEQKDESVISVPPRPKQPGEHHVSTPHYAAFCFSRMVKLDIIAAEQNKKRTGQPSSACCPMMAV